MMFYALLVASVLGSEIPPVDFDSQVLPVLTHSGCNAGACHGAAAGRGGFHLSLFGSDPTADYTAIVHFAEGRRVNLFNTSKSLVLSKPLGILDHGGGTVLEDGSSSIAVLQRWLEEGAKRGIERQLRQLRVVPIEAEAKKTGESIPIHAYAQFSDGQEIEVTEWTIFQSTDPASIEVKVSPSRAVVHRPGKHLVTARFWNKIVPVSVLLSYQTDHKRVLQPVRSNGLVDTEIDSQLDQLGLVGTPVAEDNTFLRRLRLDLTGRLPTLEELNEFHGGPGNGHRDHKVDELLEGVEFSEFWSLRLARLFRLRGSQEEPEAVAAYAQWLRNSLKSRRPYNEMVREMLTATGDSHFVGASNFTRTTKDARLHAELVGSVFMGTRIQCANCHSHPFASWTQDDYHGLAAIFSRLERGRFVQVKKIGAVTNLRTGEAATPRIPGLRDLEDADSALEQFASWLLQRDNPYFAKATVNWLWEAMMGRGLVTGVDDFRETNPPTHARLLERLAEDFVDHGFDLRRTLGWIAKSDAYARSRGNQSNVREQEVWYGAAVSRPLSPEVLLDAFEDVLLTSEFRQSRNQKRAIEMLDPATSAPELDALGRCSRSETCPSPSQQQGLASKLLAINGSLLNRRIADRNGRLQQAIADGKSAEEILLEFYERALSKKPSDSQLAVWQGELMGMSREAQARWLEDFVWSILSSNEFASNR